MNRERHEPLDPIDLPDDATGFRPWHLVTLGGAGLVLGCVAVAWAMGVFAGKPKVVDQASVPMVLPVVEVPKARAEVVKVVAKEAPKVAEPPKPIRYDASTTAVKRGDSLIKIAKAFLYGDEELIILVGIFVPKEEIKVTFDSWKSPLAVTGVQLVDNNGVSYEPKGFDLLLSGVIEPAIKEKIGGQAGMGSGAVYKDRPRFEILVFERPTSAAEYLDLDLSASAVGEVAPIRVRIHKAMWAK